MRDAHAFASPVVPLVLTLETHVNEFADCVAIVTGGASGIGRATARLVSGRGDELASFDRRGEAR